MEWLKKYKRTIIKISTGLAFIFLLVLYLTWDTGRMVVNIILVSAMLAYILRPIRDGLSKKYISKRCASLIIIFGILSLTVVVCFLLIPAFFREIGNLIPVFENLGEYIDGFFNGFSFSSSSIFDLIYDEVKIKFGTMFMNLSEDVIGGLISFSENIIAYAVIPVIVYYLLSDGERISNKAYLIVPIEKRNLVKKILRNIDRLLSRYILSQIFLCLLITVLSLGIFLILDIKFALMLSLFNGVMNIIPYFGPIFGGAPAIIIGFLMSPSKGIWVTVSIFLIQQIEGNILSPKITGKSTNMHPLVIIILLLVGDRFGGFAGMVLAVPIGVILKVIYEDINYYLF